MRVASILFAVSSEGGLAKTGIGRYALEVIGGMARSRPDWKMTVFVGPGFVPPAEWIAAGNVRAISVYPRRLIAFARWWPTDAWFFPCYDSVPTRKPAVATVHDLFPITHPEWFPDRAEKNAAAIRATVATSGRFVCDSEFSRQELIRSFGVEASRSVTVPLGPGSDGAPPVGGLDADARTKFGLPGRFFFAISTLEPRKNFPRLIEAFARFRERTPDVRLAIAGGKGWGADAVYEAIRKHGLTDEVQVLGYVSDEELAALYGACEAVVCPSLSEGFGLPVLEAMRAGAPVVTSDRGSLPEVGGDAVRYFDPEDVGAIETALRQALSDDRDVWVAAGRARAAEFTWERAAAMTAEAIERAVKR